MFQLDADLFVQRAEQVFDVAILDFPDPGVVELAKLYSTEFYQTLAKRLASDAVISVQSTSPYHTKKAFLCIGRTLEIAGFRVLPYRQNVPSFGEWGWYMAWRGEHEASDVRSAVRGVERLRVQTLYMTPEIMHAAFVFGKGWLESGQAVEPNTKLHPVLLQYYQRDWK